MKSFKITKADKRTFLLGKTNFRLLAEKYNQSISTIRDRLHIDEIRAKLECVCCHQTKYRTSFPIDESKKNLRGERCNDCIRKENFEKKKESYKSITCPDCKNTYPRHSEHFYKTSKYRCKECHKKRSAKNNKENKERHNKAVRKHMAKNRGKYREYVRIYNNKQCKELHDNYILARLRHRKGSNRQKYYKRNIEEVEDIVNKQRKKLKLEREIRKII